MRPLHRSRGQSANSASSFPMLLPNFIVRLSLISNFLLFIISAPTRKAKTVVLNDPSRDSLLSPVEILELRTRRDILRAQETKAADGDTRSQRDCETGKLRVDSPLLVAIRSSLLTTNHFFTYNIFVKVGIPYTKHTAMKQHAPRQRISSRDSIGNSTISSKPVRL